MREVIRVEGLTKYFPIRRGISDFFLRRQAKSVKAVDGIDFSINSEEIFGLAGESGCGKTTTGRLLLRLIEPTSGKVYFEEENIFEFDEDELKGYRRKAQIVFQDPYESLNPRMSVLEIVSEPLEVHDIGASEDERIDVVSKMLEKVELVPPELFLGKYPHELSGGQRQRVCIARAFILNPKFIVADEPVSMLDISIRARTLELMLKLKEKAHASCLYISHDLAMSRHICDRIAIMYLGKILELCESDELIDNPLHPYTRALVSAVPVPDPDAKREAVPIKGEVPSGIHIPSGCRFHPRCVYSKPICKEQGPRLIDAGKGHFVACHLLA